MTVRALFGLVLLNGFLLTVGVAVLFAIRGWRSWGELARLAGLAYLLGVSASGCVWVTELTVGLPFTAVTVVLTGLVLAALGAGSGWRLGRRLPPRPQRFASVASWLLPSAVLAAVTVVLFEALFRAGRLHALDEYDAWAFWVPKAKAIYFFHGLDAQFFTTLPGPSYPPLVPALEATSFQFMGNADTVTLHLQFWFLFAGFAAAVIGLLSRKVPPLLLWPPLVLALVAPQALGRALQPQADLLLDELVAATALLLGLWLLERERWQLVAATVLLAGAMVTKREGFLLAACLLVAAFAATMRNRRSWLGLALVGVLAFLPSLPWRIWFETHGLPSDAPEAGGTGLFDHLDRVWPSLKLTVRVLFTYDLWLIVAPVAILAVVAAFLAGRAALAVYAGLLLLLGVAGFTWITWSFPSLPITENPALNPIIRSVGALVLVSAGLVPLLLASAWRRDPI